MDIPINLINEIRGANVALFLGAGASQGSRNSRGENPPSGKQLAQYIAKQFLGESHKDDPLEVVSELAISEAGATNVQEYIASIFNEFDPADFHMLIPTFPWVGIATTNYDQIVERAYNKCERSNRVQNLVPWIKNTEQVDKLMRSPENILLIKLHGCISCTNDDRLPLILTVDQYITHKSGRDRLFRDYILDTG